MTGDSTLLPDLLNNVLTPLPHHTNETGNQYSPSGHCTLDHSQYRKLAYQRLHIAYSGTSLLRTPDLSNEDTALLGPTT